MTRLLRAVAWAAFWALAGFVFAVVTEDEDPRTYSGARPWRCLP